MLTGNTQFEALLRQRIAEEIERVRVNLGAGTSVKNYEDYRHQTGKIAAFERVLGVICDDVNTEINKR
jgi:hypothetical protein